MTKKGDRVEPVSDTTKHFGPGTVHSAHDGTVLMVTDRTGTFLSVDEKDVKPAK